MNNYLKILLTLLTIFITSDIYGQEDDSVEEVVVISSKTPVQNNSCHYTGIIIFYEKNCINNWGHRLFWEKIH